MAEPKWLKNMHSEDYLKEDFDAKGKSVAGTSIAGVDKNDSDWLEKAAKKSMQHRATIM